MRGGAETLDVEEGVACGMILVNGFPVCETSVETVVPRHVLRRKGASDKAEYCAKERQIDAQEFEFWAPDLSGELLHCETMVSSAEGRAV